MISATYCVSFHQKYVTISAHFIIQIPKSKLDSELMRLQIHGLRLTFQSSQPNSDGSSNRQYAWEVNDMRLSVMDTHTASVHNVLSMGRFSGHVNRGTIVPNPAVATSLLLGRIHLFVSVDRLLVLRHLGTVLGTGLQILNSTFVHDVPEELATGSTISESHFTRSVVQWTVVNASDQVGFFILLFVVQPSRLSLRPYSDSLLLVT